MIASLRARRLVRCLIAAVILFVAMLAVFRHGMLHERAGWEAPRAPAIVAPVSNHHR